MDGGSGGGAPTAIVKDSGDPTNHSDERKELYSSYAEYNKTLRTWFVTFGIGGPLLLLANTSLTKSLVDAGALRPIVYAFLYGCAIQVGIGLLNKTAGWYAYFYCDAGEDDGQPNLLQRGLIAMSSWFWIDVVGDLLTVYFFARAVVLMVQTLVA